MTENINAFQEYLSCNNIVCKIGNEPGGELLSRLLVMLKRHIPVLDIEAATREVLAREALFSNVIAPGLAVPHARIPGLSTPLIAMACSAEGFPYGDRGETVKVMILLLTPLEEPNLHMQMLAALARTFGKSGAIDAVAKLETPVEVMNWFAGDNRVLMSPYLTARDMLSTDLPILHETDTLRQVIEIFAKSRAEELAVIDRDGDLRGVAALSDLLKFSLPEHLLWMENLAPIYRFQPFSDMLKTADETRIADLMREEFLRVDADVPAVQLAKLFLVHNCRQLVITGAQGRYLGIVELKNFCAKLFWD